MSVLLLASFIAPAVLFIQSLYGRHRDDGVIAVFSAILFLLVLARLWDVAASHRRALGRERAVRLAGASLASAITYAELLEQVASRRERHDVLVGAHPAQDLAAERMIDDVDDRNVALARVVEIREAVAEPRPEVQQGGGGRAGRWSGEPRPPLGPSAALTC